MRIHTQKIECLQLVDYQKSNRRKPFWIVWYAFDYQTSTFDKSLLQQIIKKGTDLAVKVHPAAANNTITQRSHQRLLNNAIAGVLAEFVWQNFLNTVALETIVSPTKMENAASQIDLKVLRNNKTIEVRSSFPRNGIEFAICHPHYQFDILGGYSNSIKPNEIQKDFYLRTLYHIPKGTNFLSLLKQDGFKVYLTGGATWEMMVDNQLAKDKNLIPEDNLNLAEKVSTYRVVPFANALDTFEIMKRIRG